MNNTLMNDGAAARPQHVNRTDAAPSAANATHTTNEAKVRRIPLCQILHNDREVEVEHETTLYRLRLTAAGKLLLTK